MLNGNGAEGQPTAEKAKEGEEKVEVERGEPVSDAVSEGATAVPPAAPTPLEASKAALSAEQYGLAERLLADGQDRLFAHWKEGEDDGKKRAMMDQLLKLHRSYPLEDGLLSYTANARRLLAVSKEGKNPMEGWVPSVPLGETLEIGSESYDKMEALGTPLLASTGFVLVAGGLGERLGYSGIKVELPTETSTGACYLQYYCETILSLQAKYGKKGRKLPLAIMVSDDTHDGTLALLESNGYFGMDKDQVTLMKQEKVAAIADNNGSIAQSAGNLFEIEVS